MKKYRFFVLTLLFASILASLTSYNVSALSFGATDTRTYNRFNFSGAYLTNNEGNNYKLTASGAPDFVTLNNGALNFVIPTNTNVVNSFVLGFTTNLPNKYLYNLSFRICPSNPDQLRSFIGFSGDAYNSIIDQHFVINGNCLTGSLTGFGATSRQYIFLAPSGNGGLTFGSWTAGGSVIFGVPTFTIVSDDADYSSVLSAIKNNTDGIADTLDTMSSDMSSLRSAQEQEAQTAQDTYDKTIEDEQTASSSAGGFSFNFSIPNPFEIFRVSDGCVSTPTIDSWLHLEGDWQSPHCPVIPAEVRNTLTPVVTLIVTLATLLVVIRWVSGTAVDVAGNSSWLNDKPEKGAK